MKQIKFYTEQLLQFLISSIIFTTLLSIFQYFNLFSLKTSHVLSILFFLLLSFILGIFAGKSAQNRGYLEGIKLSGIIILTLLLLNVIFFQSSFSWTRILYYIFILATCIMGSMIGINKKKK